MSFPWSKPAEKEPEKKNAGPGGGPAHRIGTHAGGTIQPTLLRHPRKVKRRPPPQNPTRQPFLGQPLGGGEGGEGVSLSAARQTMNMSVTSKYHIHNPQTSAWDLTLQMHGFTDFFSATFSTLNRYQLMYQ